MAQVINLFHAVKILTLKNDFTGLNLNAQFVFLNFQYLIFPMALMPVAPFTLRPFTALAVTGSMM